MTQLKIMLFHETNLHFKITLSLIGEIRGANRNHFGTRTKIFYEEVSYGIFV